MKHLSAGPGFKLQATARGAHRQGGCRPRIRQPWACFLPPRGWAQRPPGAHLQRRAAVVILQVHLRAVTQQYTDAVTQPAPGNYQQRAAKEGVACVHISSCLEARLDARCVSPIGRMAQGRGVVVIPLVHIMPSAQQLLKELKVALLGSLVQGPQLWLRCSHQVCAGTALKPGLCASTSREGQQLEPQRLPAPFEM